MPTAGPAAIPQLNAIEVAAVEDDRGPVREGVELAPAAWCVEGQVATAWHADWRDKLAYQLRNRAYQCAASPRGQTQGLALVHQENGLLARLSPETGHLLLNVDTPKWPQEQRTVDPFPPLRVVGVKLYEIGFGGRVGFR